MFKSIYESILELFVLPNSTLVTVSKHFFSGSGNSVSKHGCYQLLLQYFSIWGLPTSSCGGFRNCRQSRDNAREESRWTPVQYCGGCSALCIISTVGKGIIRVLEGVHYWGGITSIAVEDVHSVPWGGGIPSVLPRMFSLDDDQCQQC